jgi:hypothetical protein
VSESKYYTHVAPRFPEIQSWLWCGSTEKEILKALGVGKSSFERYKKEHEELRELLRNAKSRADSDVVHAAYNMAAGYTKEVERPIKVRRVYYEEGKKCEAEEVETVTVKEYYPPQPVSNQFWLRNRSPERWKERSELGVAGEIGVTVSDVVLDKVLRSMGYAEKI